MCSLRKRLQFGEIPETSHSDTFGSLAVQVQMSKLQKDISNSEVFKQPHFRSPERETVQLRALQQTVRFQIPTQTSPGHSLKSALRVSLQSLPGLPQDFLQEGQTSGSSDDPQQLSRSSLPALFKNIFIRREAQPAHEERAQVGQGKERTQVHELLSDF